MRRELILALAGALLAAAGCASPAGPDTVAASAAAPFADCAGLTEPPTGGPSGAPRPAGGSAATGGPAAGAPLPDISLPCHAGGAEVTLAALHGPAVINVWASWCAPCRRELPVLARFADRSAGRAHVIGVVSTDDRAASAALANDLGVTFPNLYDRDGRLMTELRRAALPVTLFVDGRGTIRFVYTGRALDAEALDRLAERHLGLVPA